MTDTITINKNNQIVLNGHILSWTKASDVQRLGSVSDTLELKFELYRQIFQTFQKENIERRKNGENLIDVKSAVHKYINELCMDLGYNEVKRDKIRTECDKRKIKELKLSIINSQLKIANRDNHVVNIEKDTYFDYEYYKKTYFGSGKSNSGNLMNYSSKYIDRNKLTQDKIYDIYKNKIEYYSDKIYNKFKSIYKRGCKDDLYNEVYIVLQDIVNKYLKNNSDKEVNLIDINEKIARTFNHYLGGKRFFDSCLNGDIQLGNNTLRSIYELEKTIVNINNKQSNEKDNKIKECSEKMKTSNEYIEKIIKACYMIEDRAIQREFDIDTDYKDVYDESVVNTDNYCDMYNDIDNDIDLQLLSEELKIIMCTLTEREWIVLKYRFGFYDGNEHSLESTAKLFDVTTERVRQIEAKALRKLRAPQRSHKIKYYIDSYYEREWVG